ncbi:MAG: type II toxin-antitoxin system RelE/ParE family toxin [Proteobacteria bacterium]|nr:type II toxin-antitoxin system RelE/ParE family toxin [Pseudomonadota bacterium]
MAKIKWNQGAIEDLEKLDKPVAQRILKKIDWLSENFEKVTPEHLSGQFKGTFKLRIGDWRVVYTVKGETLVIQFIGHRRDIYNTL